MIKIDVNCISELQLVKCLKWKSYAVFGISYLFLKKIVGIVINCKTCVYFFGLNMFLIPNKFFLCICSLIFNKFYFRSMSPVK